ncbi:hypothetical protein CsSME_00035548 [Camellia sinensis var. sinensis]
MATLSLPFGIGGWGGWIWVVGRGRRGYGLLVGVEKEGKGGFRGRENIVWQMKRDFVKTKEELHIEHREGERNKGGGGVVAGFCKDHTELWKKQQQTGKFKIVARDEHKK